ncbi:hypothetical protein [Lachnoclostridium phytofermentans]|uniref:hypothetical protein n=1 Tax=Lachnoclostridium phytofermentans TaxID=66219 RepID=UPI0004953E16|nr:hypothetical protein [Lachnoclostridium phytofermentans]
MRNNATITVKTWDGQQRAIHNAELRAELDQGENVFFKIEGKHEDDIFMIYYDYNREKATAEYNQLTNRLLRAQERWLEQYVDKYR